MRRWLVLKLKVYSINTGSGTQKVHVMYIMRTFLYTFEY